MLSDEDGHDKEDGKKGDCNSEEYAIAEFFLMLRIAFCCFNGTD